MINKVPVQKGSTVLDLGCGTGYLTKVLSERVGPEGRVAAVDPDEERLKIARERYSADNIEYIQADDKTFPEVGHYDLVFANQMIHWTRNKEAVLKRVYDNLKPGGQFAFTTVDTTSSQAPSELAQIPREEGRIMQRLFGPDVLTKIQSCMSFLSIKEYEALASACNYSQASVDTDNQQHEWATLDEYLDMIHGWWHGIINQSNLDEDVIQQFRKECELKSGPAIRMHRTYLYVVLTK